MRVLSAPIPLWRWSESFLVARKHRTRVLHHGLKRRQPSSDPPSAGHLLPQAGEGVAMSSSRIRLDFAPGGFIHPGCATPMETQFRLPDSGRENSRARLRDRRPDDARRGRASGRCRRRSSRARAPRPFAGSRHSSKKGDESDRLRERRTRSFRRALVARRVAASCDSPSVVSPRNWRALLYDLAQRSGEGGNRRSDRGSPHSVRSARQSAKAIDLAMARNAIRNSA